MIKAVVVRQTGDSNVMQIEQSSEPRQLKAGQVLIRQTCIGINYNDIYYRNGSYPVKTPFVPGTEACGIIESKSGNIGEFQVGDRVAYFNSVVGAYCEKRIANYSRLVIVPDYISDEVAVATLAKGMVAHMLAFRTYRIQKGQNILVYSAAGGVGQLLSQWASHLGAYVIGAVGSDAKIQTAFDAGCKEVFNYKKDDFVNNVIIASKNKGVTVAYDSVGKETVNKSMECLAPLGLLVSYGHTSGITPPLNIASLSKKGNFVTYPLVNLYKSDKIEMALTAREVFMKINEGVLRASIYKKYSLGEIAQAHLDLESGNTRGQLIVKL